MFFLRIFKYVIKKQRIRWPGKYNDHITNKNQLSGRFQNICRLRLIWKLTQIFTLNCFISQPGTPEMGHKIITDNEKSLNCSKSNIRHIPDSLRSICFDISLNIIHEKNPLLGQQSEKCLEYDYARPKKTLILRERKILYRTGCRHIR